MDIILIIGMSNQGKSSLIRCLTGKSQDRHSHPHIGNVLTLDWEEVGSQNTLVLISSLNEGFKYSNFGYKVYNKSETIHPLDLGSMLDSYSTFSKKPATKAILCISNSVKDTYWTTADYYDVLANPKSPNFLTQHNIINTVLIGANDMSVNWYNPISVAGLGTPVNTVANSARTILPLI